MSISNNLAATKIDVGSVAAFGQSLAILNPELSPKCRVVVAIDAPGKNLFFQEIPLSMLTSNKSSWKKTQSLIKIPKTSVPNSTLTIYFWNKGRNNLHIDNMEIYVN